MLHLANARSDAPSPAWARLATHRYAIAAVVVAAGLQVATVLLPPVSLALRLEPLAAAQWQGIVGAALLPLAAGQLWRLQLGRRK